METGLEIKDTLIAETPLSQSGIVPSYREQVFGAGSNVAKFNDDGFFIGATEFSSAPFKVSYSGVVTASGAIIRGSLNADDITAGTLSGRTIKATGGGGSDVWIDSSDGSVKFYYGGVEKSFIFCNSSGNVLFDADQGIYITAVTDFSAIADSITMVSRTDLISVFNDDGGSDTAKWVNDTSLTMEHRDNGDLAISGSYL